MSATMYATLGPAFQTMAGQPIPGLRVDSPEVRRAVCFYHLENR